MHSLNEERRSAANALGPGRLLATMPACALSALPIEGIFAAVAQLDAASAAAVPPATLAALPPATLAALPAAALAGLRPAHLAALSEEALATFPAQAQAHLTRPALDAALQSVALRGLGRALAQAPTMALARRFVEGCDGGLLDLAAFEHVILGCFDDPDAALAVPGMGRALRAAFADSCATLSQDRWKRPGAAFASAPLAAAVLIERGVSARALTRAFFDIFDVDRDGVLCRIELAACVNALVERGHPSTSTLDGGLSDEGERTFALLSRGTGAVAFARFREWVMELCGRTGEAALRAQARSATLRTFYDALRCCGLDGALRAWKSGCGAYVTISAAQFARTPPLAVMEQMGVGLLDGAYALTTLFHILTVDGDTGEGDAIPLRSLVGGLAVVCGASLDDIEAAMGLVFAEGDVTQDEVAQLLRSMFIVGARISSDARLRDVAIETLVGAATHLSRLCFWRENGAARRTRAIAEVCAWMRLCCKPGDGLGSLLARTRSPPPGLPARSGMPPPSPETKSLGPTRGSPEELRGPEARSPSASPSTGRELLGRMLAISADERRASTAASADLLASAVAVELPLGEGAPTALEAATAKKVERDPATRWLSFGRASALAAGVGRSDEDTSPGDDTASVVADAGADAQEVAIKANAGQQKIGAASPSDAMQAAKPAEEGVAPVLEIAPGADTIAPTAPFEPTAPAGSGGAPVAAESPVVAVVVEEQAPERSAPTQVLSDAAKEAADAPITQARSIASDSGVSDAQEVSAVAREETMGADDDGEEESATVPQPAAPPSAAATPSAPVLPVAPPPGPPPGAAPKKKKKKKKRQKKAESCDVAPSLAAASSPVPPPPGMPLAKKKKKSVSAPQAPPDPRYALKKKKKKRLSEKRGSAPIAPPSKPPTVPPLGSPLKKKKRKKGRHASQMPPPGEPPVRRHDSPERPPTMPRQSGSSDGTLSHRAQLVALWVEHAPQKVANVDRLLAKHAGEEGAFVAKQRAKYGGAAGVASTAQAPDPAPPAAPAAAGGKRPQDDVGVEAIVEVEAETEAEAAREAETGDQAEAETEANAAILEAPAEASADAADAAAETAQRHRDELTALYAQYAPHKLATVDKMLIKYAGKEHKMLAALRSKYEQKAAEDARVADAAIAEGEVAASAQDALSEDNGAPCDALERAQLLMQSEDAAKAEKPKRTSRPLMNMFKKRPSANKTNAARASSSAGTARDLRAPASASSPSRASAGVPGRGAPARGASARGASARGAPARGAPARGAPARGAPARAAVGRSPPGARAPTDSARAPGRGPPGSRRSNNGATPSARGPPGARKPGHPPGAARAPPGSRRSGNGAAPSARGPPGARKARGLPSSRGPPGRGRPSEASLNAPGAFAP